MSLQSPRPAPLSDVKTLREQARSSLNDGAVTRGYSLDLDEVYTLMNEALATELVCVLRYRRHYFMSRGIAGAAVEAEFLEHANDEQRHADQIAERIVQLGGEPDFNPQTLTERSHAEYVTGKTVADMVTEDLVAERIAIESYRQLIAYFGEHDPTTRRLFEEILSTEEEHADDMSDLLEDLMPPDMRVRA